MTENRENLRLKPFHLGSRNGHRYLINIEDMRAYPLDMKTTDLLQQADDTVEHTWLSQNKEQLELLGLLAHEEKSAPKTPKALSVVNAAFFLTQSCNLRCRYCYGEGGEYGHKGDMDEKTAFQGVDWLIEQSGKQKKIHIGFFGGEPFLNFPLMQKIVDYAREKTDKADKKVSFHATTNGTLLDEKQINFIQDQDINVMISLDGAREIQDSQRPFGGGKGSYDHIVPKVKNLLAVRPQTPGHAVLMEGTDPREVKEAMREIGFTQVSITPASDCMLSCEKKPGPDRDLLNVLAPLEQETDLWLEGIKGRDSSALTRLMNNSELYPGLVTFLHGSKRFFPCGAGRGLMGISCKGDAYLCHRFVGMEEYKLGNVFDTHIDRDEFLKSPIDVMEKCGDCPARYYCAGNCRYDNAASTGSVFQPAEEMCRLRCREFELCAFIASRLDAADRAFLQEEDIVPVKPCPLDLG